MTAYRNRIEVSPVPQSAYQKETTMTDKIEIEVPIQLLDAAQYCAAKNDKRFYLNGVALSKGHIVSTDGHRAFACKVEGLSEDLKDIIIPIDTIKHFLKKVPKVLRKGVCIVQHDFKTLESEIKIENRPDIREPFIGIAAKYPDWRRVIPKTHNEGVYNDFVPQFNWAYLAEMQKVHKALGGNSLGVEVLPVAVNAAASIKFTKTDFDHAIACVMPMRI